MGILLWLWSGWKACPLPLVHDKAPMSFYLPYICLFRFIAVRISVLPGQYSYWFGTPGFPLFPTFMDPSSSAIHRSWQLLASAQKLATESWQKVLRDGRISIKPDWTAAVGFHNFSVINALGVVEMSFTAAFYYRARRFRAALKSITSLYARLRVHGYLTPGLPCFPLPGAEHIFLRRFWCEQDSSSLPVPGCQIAWITTGCKCAYVYDCARC